MENINQTGVSYVRCIKPNTQFRSDLYDEKGVNHQLRCQGILEARLPPKSPQIALYTLSAPRGSFFCLCLSFCVGADYTARTEIHDIYIHAKNATPAWDLPIPSIRILG